MAAGHGKPGPGLLNLSRAVLQALIFVRLGFRLFLILFIARLAALTGRRLRRTRRSLHRGLGFCQTVLHRSRGRRFSLFRRPPLPSVSPVFFEHPNAPKTIRKAAKTSRTAFNTMFLPQTISSIKLSFSRLNHICNRKPLHRHSITVFEGGWAGSGTLVRVPDAVGRRMKRERERC